MEERLKQAFVATVGREYALTPPENLGRYTDEGRGIYFGKTPLVLKPGTTQEVSSIVRLAAKSSTGLVPQGGHTGHVGGAVPDETGNQVVVSLERMNRILEVDLTGNTMTVQAGAILADVQRAASDVNRLFPLTLGSQGSCQIGGNISTNAGGMGVLAYGNTRDLVLGIEAVLASGAIWNGLGKLRKDNTGYSLKNLLIGAEGTLGIITSAVLRLFPMPKGRETAWIGLSGADKALDLLRFAQERAGNCVTVFELVQKTAMDFAVRHLDQYRAPLATEHEWYVLMELSSWRSQEDAEQLLETVLEAAFERSLVGDAAIARNISQQEQFRGLREDLSLAQKCEGASIKHDISVPVELVPAFLARAGEVVGEIAPEARICAFGHLGDGNIHYNLSQPVNGEGEAFLALREQINERVHRLVVEMGGSVSAEHGIGRLKKDLLAKVKSDTELNMMRAIKKALDPDNIMNPGKVLDL